MAIFYPPPPPFLGGHQPLVPSQLTPSSGPLPAPPPIGWQGFVPGWAWQVPWQPLPQTAPFSVPAPVVVGTPNPAWSNLAYWTILRTWQPPPPLPTLPPLITQSGPAQGPQNPAWSNPNLRTVLETWQPIWVMPSQTPKGVPALAAPKKRQYIGHVPARRIGMGPVPREAGPGEKFKTRDSYEERLARFTEQVATLLNSFIAQDIFFQTGPVGWQFGTGGALPVTKGGTGATTLPPNSIPIGHGTGDLTFVTAASDGQVLVGKASGAPVFAAVSGDATLSAAGVLTLTKVLDAYKANGAQGVANSTVLVNDDQLILSLLANSTYKFVFQGPWKVSGATGTPGIKIALSGTSGLGNLAAWLKSQGSSQPGTFVTSFGVTDGVNLGNVTAEFLVEGTIATTAAGNLVLQWAQNTADATGTTAIQQGAFCQAIRQ